jgi:predicted aspartyl protease
MMPGYSVRFFALSLCLAGVLAGAPARAEDCRLAQAAVIPLEEARDGHFAIQATIEGETVKLVLDTGASGSFIDRSFVERHGLTQIDTPILGYGLTGKPIDHVARLGRLSLGTAMIKDSTFAVSELAPSQLADNIVGLLGSNYLTRYDVEIDTEGGKLKLFRQDHCPGRVVYWAHEYFKVPVHLTPDRRLEVGIDIDGKALRALIDTGAFRTTMRLATARDVFDVAADSPGSTSLGKISGVEGITLDSFSHRFAHFTLGGITVENSEITIADIDAGRGAEPRIGTLIRGQLDQQDVLIGTPLLRRLHLFIAYSESTVYFTVNQSDQAAQQ